MYICTRVCVYIYIFLSNAVLLKISGFGALGSKEDIAFFFFALFHFFDNFEN